MKARSTLTVPFGRPPPAGRPFLGFPRPAAAEPPLTAANGPGYKAATPRKPTWHPNFSPAGHRGVIRKGEGAIWGGQPRRLLPVLGELPVDISHRGGPRVLPRLTVAAGLRSQSWRREERSSRRVLERKKSQQPMGLDWRKMGTRIVTRPRTSS